MENQKRKQKNKALLTLLGKKGVALIATGSLLVVLIIAGTAAWYTRVNTISQMTIDAANFDFTANYVDEDFVVQANEYMNVTGTSIAPGTGGVIPIKLSATMSDADVAYMLDIKTENMAQEFRDRILFYYWPADSTGNDDYVILNSSNDTIHGTIPAHTSSMTEYIYWKWIYEPTASLYYNKASAKWVTAAAISPSSIEVQAFESIYTEGAIDDHNDFDTDIGLGKYDDEISVTGSDGQITTYTSTSSAVYIATGPSLVTERVQTTLKAYQRAIEVKIEIVGAQAEPLHTGDARGAVVNGVKTTQGGIIDVDLRQLNQGGT